MFDILLLTLLMILIEHNTIFPYNFIAEFLSYAYVLMIAVRCIECER